MSTTLFDNLNIVKTRFVEYLMSINENINWLDFLNKYGTLPDVKILKRIRSLIWIDKSIDYDPITYVTTKYFKYYISLLMKFVPIIRKHGPIYVIPPKTAENSPLIDEFQYDLDMRFSILKRVLNMMRIEYVIINMSSINSSDIENMRVLLPLGSICYEKVNETFATFKGVVIPDGYENICFTKEDEILNTFILNIKSLMMSSEDVSALIQTHFNMFYIKQCKNCEK